MNKKYIIELTNINPDYQDDVEGNLEDLFYNVVEFATDVKITDITEEAQIGRYVFIFEYGSDWMILLYKDGKEYKYYNSAEDGWDNSLDHANDFVSMGGAKYYYQLPDYEHVANIDVFSLKNEPIEELEDYLL